MRRGFNVFVGNPPFLGGKRISTILGDPYRDWLAAIHEDASSNTDLVAHFFRRGFDLLATPGALGFIATNTIAQGDTRLGGLRAIVARGGRIFGAERRIRWPGLAVVTISVVRVYKGELPATTAITMDGHRVDRITSFLFNRGGDDAPRPLARDWPRVYIGTFVRGSGFLFADGNEDASPIREMRRLLDDSRNAARLRPYIGGEDINSHPAHAHCRYVIDFSGLEEREARSWPALMEVVERRVRPFRERLGDGREDTAHKKNWWRFGQERPGLYHSIAGLSCVTAVARVTTHLGFVRLPTHLVYSDQVVVINSDKFSTLATLQSRIHEGWARFFSSSLVDALRYAPSDCFDTFPFPPLHEVNPVLEAVGRAYDEFRSALMLKSDE
ncbi:MAG: type IIL restriction-modification enzyme MmeI, partial [Polyangiaceae bacterium]